MMSSFWENVGMAGAAVCVCACFAYCVLSVAERQLKALARHVRATPFRAALGAAAAGVLVAYGGSKPPVETNYAVDYVLGEEGDDVVRDLYEPGKVYALRTFGPMPDGRRLVGWSCSNGRRYDDGMLVFNLADPGGIVTMRAIWE